MSKPQPTSAPHLVPNAGTRLPVQLVEAQRALDRIQDVQRQALETVERNAEAIGLVAVANEEGMLEVTATVAEQVQQVAATAGDAITVFRDTTQKTGDDLRAVAEASSLAFDAMSEIGSLWIDLAGRRAQANTEAMEQLLSCRDFKELAEVQRDIMTKRVRDYMDGSAQMLHIAQRVSGQASRPLESRLTEAA